MEEILHAFGIDWRLIVIQIFNFGILVAVLWYFLYTPILNLLKEREEKIKKGVEDAKKAEEARKAADLERTNILKEAQIEAQQIIARGNQLGEEKASALEKEAAEKIARELKSAELRAEELRRKALKESEAEIAKLAILGAEMVLNQRLSK